MKTLSMNDVDKKSPVSMMIALMEAILPDHWLSFCARTCIALHHQPDDRKSIIDASCGMFQTWTPFAKLLSERGSFICEGLFLFAV